MLKREQSIEGNNNLQAGRDINLYGNSYTDVKEIALDIFRSQLPYLTQKASDKAWERVEPVLNEILVQIHQKKPEAINEFAEPEVQYMLGNAMKTAGSTDDDVVCDVLVQLAVDHVLSEGKSYERIVDEQAIEMLQKINRGILKSLQEAAIWTQNYSCRWINANSIIQCLRKCCYFSYEDYLEFIGCIVKKDNLDLRTLFEQNFLNFYCSKVRELYGYFFHGSSSEIKKIVEKHFGSIDSCEVIDKIYNFIYPDRYFPENKKTYYPFFSDDCWEDAIMRELPYHFFHREDIVSFISEAFYSENQIFELISNVASFPPYFNKEVFKYSLTPIGRRLAQSFSALLV